MHPFIQKVVERVRQGLSFKQQPPPVDGDDLETVTRLKDKLRVYAARLNSVQDELHTYTIETGYLNIADLIEDIDKSAIAIRHRQAFLHKQQTMTSRLTLDDFFLDKDQYPLDVYKTVRRLSDVIEELAEAYGQVPDDDSRRTYYQRHLIALYREIRGFHEVMSHVR